MRFKIDIKSSRAQVLTQPATSERDQTPAKASGIDSREK